jgi:hypothetical protein
MFTIATLMMSACEPCMIEFTARRSPSERVCRFEARISGTGRRLRDEGRGALLVLQVHDELLLEVPEAEVGPVRELVREEMCRAYPLDPPLAVEIGVGDDWSEAKS